MTGKWHQYTIALGLSSCTLWYGEIAICCSLSWVWMIEFCLNDIDFFFFDNLNDIELKSYTLSALGSICIGCCENYIFTLKWAFVIKKKKIQNKTNYKELLRTLFSSQNA